MSSIEVVPSVFEGPGRPGDFAWMIDRPEYADALFVFNDNEQQFRAHQLDPDDRLGCAPGGGNAAIRPWQCRTPPRAGGIPTGDDRGGYGALTDDVRSVIDEAVGVIAGIAADHGYRRVVYSSDGEGGLGTGVFVVADEVKRYVVDSLTALGD